jgi:hypothetical protein
MCALLVYQVVIITNSIATMSKLSIVIILLINIHKLQCSTCHTPVIDSIFVLDGTITVGAANFNKMKSFINAFVDKMTISLQDSRIGVVQFTPTARPEFYPLNYLKNDLVKNAVDKIPFTPCTGTKAVCYGSAQETQSLNYVAQFGLSAASGNRPRIPDIMVVIVGENYLPTVSTLSTSTGAYQSTSSLYVFLIRVGAMNSGKLGLNIPFASETTEMHVDSYDKLSGIVESLCNEINTKFGK